MFILLWVVVIVLLYSERNGEHILGHLKEKELLVIYIPWNLASSQILIKKANIQSCLVF